MSNKRLNPAGRCTLQLDPKIENERILLENIERVQPVIDEVYKEAKNLIGKAFPDYHIPLTLDDSDKSSINTIYVKANELSSRIFGSYYMRGIIEINIDEVEAYISEENPRVKESRYKKLVEVMVHEIGHRIHHIHWDYKTVRLPRVGRTLYAGKNGRENFAEAFENLVTSDLVRYQDRNIALRKAFDNKFNPQEEIKAAKNTIPERRKSLITLDTICQEIGMTTKAARVKLRKSGKFTKGESGWAWEANDPEMEIIKKFLKGEK